MNEETFQRKVSQLIAVIDTLPADDRAKLQRMVEQTRESNRQHKKTVDELEESMDFVRLSIQYMLSALAATRGEHLTLRRKQLDELGEPHD